MRLCGFYRRRFAGIGRVELIVRSQLSGTLWMEFFVPFGLGIPVEGPFRSAAVYLWIPVFVSLLSAGDCGSSGRSAVAVFITEMCRLGAGVGIWVPGCRLRLSYCGDPKRDFMDWVYLCPSYVSANYVSAI